MPSYHLSETSGTAADLAQESRQAMNQRREFLVGAAAALIGKSALADVVSGAFPWSPNVGTPPIAFEPGGWKFFTAAEAAMVEAIADRIIPPDPGAPGTPVSFAGLQASGAQSPPGAPGASGPGTSERAVGTARDYRADWCPGGKQAGCAVFLDRQLAGPWGHAEGLYEKGPFQKGTKQQGDQAPETPQQHYRTWLAAIDRYCRSLEGGQPFAEMPIERQDTVLSGLENGNVDLGSGLDPKKVFDHLVLDIQTGFFADPLYGGNRDMCAWKMIGFPGAHYDYRDWVDKYNERYPHPPVAIYGRPGWTPGRS